MKKSIIFIALVCVFLVPCFAYSEITGDISDSIAVMTSPLSFTLRNVTINASELGFSGKYWADFQWDSTKLAFVPTNVGQEATNCADVAYAWSIREDVDATDCGEGKYTEYHTYCVTQAGCALTITKGVGIFDGEINGYELTFSGDYEEDEGETSFNVTATISQDGNSLDGSSEWDWDDGEDGFYNCSGTSEITGTRL
jgi:hypothetical protein